MSSEAAHFLVAASFALPVLKSHKFTAVLPAWTIPIASGLFATIPDIDLAVTRFLGHTRGRLFEHRGLLHSPFFLIVLSGVLAAIVTRHHGRASLVRFWLLWAVCMITHPLLDALTDGGQGVMLLLPFTRARFHFLWRPLQTEGWSGGIVGHAFFLRPTEIPFCLATLMIGFIGLLFAAHRFNRS